MAKGHEVLRQRRAAGLDPAHGGSAAVARGARRVETRRAMTEWEAKHPTPPDQAVYGREVLPRVRSASVPAIVRATGLSYSYCALIRRGLRVPHPRHWDALGKIGGDRYAHEWTPSTPKDDVLGSARFKTHQTGTL